MTFRIIQREYSDINNAVCTSGAGTFFEQEGQKTKYKFRFSKKCPIICIN